MKHPFLLERHLFWHVSHAFALLMASLVLFERLVPGAVLGHVSLFIGVPLLVVCFAFQPPATRKTPWWSIADLAVIAFICVVRAVQRLSNSGPLAWILASIVILLTLWLLWVLCGAQTSEE